MVPSRYHEAKFAELVLYCAELLEADRSGGATKLNKLLYFAEFEAIRRTGASITGVTFQRLAHGPAPRPLLPVRSQLVREGRAELRAEVDRFGYRHARLVALRPADRSVFSDEERATIEEVAARLGSMTAAQVSELSHRDPGWRLAAEGETIPGASAHLAAEAVIPARMRETVAERAEALATEHGDRALG